MFFLLFNEVVIDHKLPHFICVFHSILLFRLSYIFMNPVIVHHFLMVFDVLDNDIIFGDAGSVWIGICNSCTHGMVIVSSSSPAMNFGNR